MPQWLVQPWENLKKGGENLYHAQIIVNISDPIMAYLFSHLPFSVGSSSSASIWKPLEALLGTTAARCYPTLVKLLTYS